MITEASFQLRPTQALFRKERGQRTAALLRLRWQRRQQRQRNDWEEAFFHEMNCRMRSSEFSDFGNRGQVSLQSHFDLKTFVNLIILGIALAGNTIVFGQQKPEAIPRDTNSDLLWKKLETRVEEIGARLDGVMGVAILDLTDGRILLRNADRVFPAASSIKLAILLELYRQDQEARTGAKGKAKLDDIYIFDPKDLVEDSRIMAGLTPGVTRVTNRDVAQFMIAVSDNAAANILIDRLGKDNVNAMLHGLGLSKTMLRRKMIDIAAARRGDENVATPQEMVRLLEAIYKGKALNKESTAEFIKRLSTKKDSYIPRLLPVDVQVANKPGELEAVRTDSGIVFAPHRPFAISVMSAYDRDEKAAERAISEVALEAYRYFEMRGKTSQYGRALPKL
jgi:beta-lactamase class A